MATPTTPAAPEYQLPKDETYADYNKMRGQIYQYYAQHPQYGQPTIDTAEQIIEKQIGYQPSFWQNPQRVARYYNALQMAPKGWQPPEWFDSEAVTNAYKYFQYRNGNTPWTEWKFLPSEDAGLPYLAQMATPPEEYLWSNEYDLTPSLGAVQQGYIAWSSLDPDMRKELLDNPNFDITQYAPAVRNEILADANFPWDRYPGWQKSYHDFLSSPQGSMVQGVIPGVLAGASAGTAIAPGVGTIIGGVVGGLAGGVLGYGAAYGNPTAMKIMQWLNWPAQQVENTAGLITQAVAAGVDPEEYGDIKEVFDNFHASYLAGGVAWDQVLKGIVGKDFVIGSNKTVPTGNIIKPLVRTRQELMEVGRAGGSMGAASLQEQALAQSEPLAMISNMALQMVFDPLNYVHTVSNKVIGKTLESSHPNAARAFKETHGLIEAGRRYADIIRTTPGAAENLHGMERFFAGITDKGTLRAGPFTNQGLLDQPTGKEGFAHMLSTMTPEARAVTGQALAQDNLRAILWQFNDPEKVGAYFRAIGAGDMETAASMARAMTGTPEFYTILPVLKDFANNRMPELVEIYTNPITQEHITMLNRVAEVMGMKPADLLDNLESTADSARSFELFKAKLEASNTAQARSFLEEIAAGTFTADDLKSITDMFTGPGKIPWTVDLWNAMVGSALDDHFAEWSKKYLGLKPDSGAFRMFHVLKSAQSILLMGGNPAYAVRNAINDMVTRAAAGVGGFLLPRQMDSWLERFGVSPYRMSEGIGMLGEGEGFAGEGATRRMIADIRQGQKGVLRTADNALRGIGSKMPFTRLSSWVEGLESKQATVIGMRKVWGRIWSRGIGFKKMPPELISRLRSIRPDAPDMIYRAIEAGMNMNEITRTLQGQERALQVRGMIDAAAQRAGMAPRDAATLLDHLGVVDRLDELLTNAKTPRQVDAAFNAIHRRVQDNLDAASARLQQEHRVEVSNRIKVEGPKAGADFLADTVATETEAWLNHYDRLGDVWDSIDAIEDEGMRHRLIQEAYKLSAREFERSNNRTMQTYRGMVDTMGWTGKPNIDRFLSSIEEIHRAKTDAYTALTAEDMRIYDKYQGDWKNPDRWDEIKAASAKKDAAFKEMFKTEHLKMVEAGDAMAAHIAETYGREAGTAFRRGWDDLLKFRDEMIRRELAFREQVREARANGADSAGIRRMKAEFYQNDKLAQIVEYERLRDVMGQTLGDVINGRTRPPEPTPTGAPVTPPPEAPNAPAGTRITPEMVQHLRDIGYSQADLNNLTAQQALDILEGRTPPKVQPAAQPAAKPAPAQPEAQPAQGGLFAQEAVDNVAFQDEIVRNHEAEIFQAASKYGFGSADEFGKPVGDARKTLISLVKQYGGERGKYIRRFSDLTPELVEKTFINQAAEKRAQEILFSNRPTMPEGWDQQVADAVKAGEIPAEMSRRIEEIPIGARTDAEQAALDVDLKNAKNLAFTDTELGIKNKAAYKQELAAKMLPPFQVIFDLDFFKTINDAGSHALGDEVLTMYAMIVADNMPPEFSNFLYRYGGDELIACVGTEEQAIALVKGAQELARQAHIEVEYRDPTTRMPILDANGQKQVVAFDGIRFQAGIGKDFGSADENLRLTKQRPDSAVRAGYPPDAIVRTAETGWQPIVTRTGESNAPANLPKPEGGSVGEGVGTEAGAGTPVTPPAPVDWDAIHRENTRTNLTGEDGKFTDWESFLDRNKALAQPLQDALADLQQTAKEAPVNPQNLIRSINKAGGIALDERMDIAGDKTGFMPGLFRKDGMPIDNLVQWLIEEGYLTEGDRTNPADNGGINAARELIRRAMDGEKIMPNGESVEPDWVRHVGGSENAIRLIKQIIAGAEDPKAKRVQFIKARAWDWMIDHAQEYKDARQYLKIAFNENDNPFINQVQDLTGRLDYVTDLEGINQMFEEISNLGETLPDDAPESVRTALADLQEKVYNLQDKFTIIEQSNAADAVAAAHAETAMTRSLLREQLQDLPNIPADQVEAFLSLLDARAEAWAKATGRSVDDWYAEKWGGIIRHGPGEKAPEGLMQGIEQVDDYYLTAARNDYKTRPPVDSVTGMPKDKGMIQRAKKAFGLTDNLREGGYLLDDGTMLDFSGKNDGGPTRMRSYDHRQISEAFTRPTPDRNGTGDAPITHFAMQTGAIRMGVYGREAVLDIFARTPSPEQLATIRGWFEDGEVDHMVVDFSTGEGYIVASAEFEGPEAVSEFYRAADRIYAGEESAGDLSNSDFLFQEGNGPSPVWYSKLENVITDKMPNRADANTIRGLLNSQGVKLDEINSRGFNKWLDNQKGPITKADVISYLQENQIKVKEVMKGKGRRLSPEEATERLTLGLHQHLTPAERTRYNELSAAEMPNTKYEGYTLPGGENYRELLFTLPTKSENIQWKQTGYGSFEAQINGHDLSIEPEGNRFYVYEKDGLLGSVADSAEDAKHLAENYALGNPTDEYQSPHWTEPNVLAHTRLTDRIDADWKKVLFVEEIQSDWHQQGREQGYNPSQKPLNESEIVVVDLPDGSYGVTVDGVLMQQSTTREAAVRAAEHMRNNTTPVITGVPMAPFAKTWPDLVMKRIIRMAAEEGYDRVAWTTGEQQSARYNLSKQVSEIRYRPKGEGQFELEVMDKDHRDIFHENATPDRITELVGKDVTDRILANKGREPVGGFIDSDWRVLEGEENLTVGGQGMKGFYDQMLPEATQKYIKKWGGKVTDKKVSMGRQLTYDQFATEYTRSWGQTTPEEMQALYRTYGPEAGAVTHGFDITDSMRKAVMEEGQPLFQDEKAVIEFQNNKAYVHLFEQSDISSLVHEAGHLFRRDLEFEDLRTVEDWAGVKDGVWEREHEEKFARAFERYLAEGKAPTPALVKVFAAFKDWLIKIYKAITGSPIDVEITPAVKEVFDRLLGAEPLTPEVPSGAILPDGGVLGYGWKSGYRGNSIFIEFVNRPTDSTINMLQEAGYKTVDGDTSGQTWIADRNDATESLPAKMFEMQRTNPVGSETDQITGRQIRLVDQNPEIQKYVKQQQAQEQRIVQQNAATTEPTFDTGQAGGLLPGMTDATGMMLDVQPGSGQLHKMEAPNARSITDVVPGKVYEGPAGTFKRGDIVADAGGTQHEVAGVNVRGQIVTKAGDLLDPAGLKLVAGQNTFFQEADPRFPAGGYDQNAARPPEYDALAEGWQQFVRPLLDGLQEESRRQLDQPAFSVGGADDETQALLKRYLDGVKQDMAGAKLQTVRFGETARDNALLNYNRRYGFDKYLDTIMPYQLWYTRSMINWAARALDRPGWFSALARSRMGQNQYTSNTPERLRGKIAIPAPFLPDWMGSSVYIDPWSMFFPFAQFAQPFDQLARDQNNQVVNAQRILQEWASDGSVDPTQAASALKTQSGTLWDKAMAEASMNQQAEISSPFDFMRVMMGPAWYLSAPLEAAGVKVPYLSTGNPQDIGTLPLSNTANAAKAVTAGTWAEPIGDILGVFAKPEEWARKALDLPQGGQFGDYYIDRMIANLVADGLATPEQGKLAMIERSGPVYEQAKQRAALEQAMRIPGMGAAYTALHGGGVAGTAESMIPSIFGMSLLPAGELKYRGLQDKWNAAWKVYDAGDKSKVTQFFDDHPEFEVYLARKKDPDTRLRTYLVGEIWDRYMLLDRPNKRLVGNQMGSLFQYAFLDSETRNYDGLDLDTLAAWAKMLGAAVPKTEATSKLPSVNQAQPQLQGMPVETDKLLNIYNQEKAARFPGIDELQNIYFAVPQVDRKRILASMPELQAYWNWRKAYIASVPEIRPFIDSAYAEKIMSGEITVDPTTRSLLANYYSPDYQTPFYSARDYLVGASGILMKQLQDYKLRGNPLSDGAMTELRLIWEAAGKPTGSLQKFLNEVIIPTME